MRASLKQIKHMTAAERVLSTFHKIVKSPGFCLEEDRGMLLVTVLLSTRSRTQTSPL